MEEAIILAGTAKGFDGQGPFIWVVRKEHEVIDGRDFIINSCNFIGRKSAGDGY